VFDRHADEDNDAVQNCRISRSVKLLTNIGNPSKTETDIISESVLLFANVGTAGPQSAIYDIFIKTPETQCLRKSTLCIQGW
jgi:hypothetical protein